MLIPPGTPSLWAERQFESATVDFVEACPAWRRIGRKPPGDTLCPTPPAPWTVAPLFDGDDLLPEMTTYCVYEHPTDGLQPKLPAGMAPHSDCMGMVAQGNDSSEPALEAAADLESMLEKTFLYYAGIPESFPPSLLSETRPRPRLAILDTTPTEKDDPRDCSSASLHGDTLVHMADRLLCRQTDGSPRTRCAAHVTTRLALRWLEFSADGQVNDDENAPCRGRQGGYVGTIADLADAINDEINAWKDAQAEDATVGGLILNLSIGWDGEGFGGYEPDSRIPAIDAVLDALRRAKRENVLVIAAAGNTSWGPEPGSRAVLPAGWEDLERDPPLVYAVGGLRSLDAPLANARPRATWSRYMAYGDHATVRPTPGYDDPETTVLTGTSVSTLVVSAAAALVWAMDSEQSPHDVMTTVHDYAVPLANRQNEVSSWRTEAGVRRVRLCRLLQKLTPEGASCPPEPTMPASMALPANGPAPDFDYSKLQLDDLTLLTECEEMFHSGDRDPEGLDVPCPHVQFPSAQAAAGTHPQPGSDMCPACNVDPIGLALLDLDEELIPLTTNMAVLSVAGQTFQIPFDRQNNPGLVFDVGLPGSMALGGDAGALVSVRIDKERSMVSTLWNRPR